MTEPTGRHQLAAMPLQLEPHPLTRQSLRVDPTDPSALQLELVYPGSQTHSVGGWRVTADNPDLILDDRAGLVNTPGAGGGGLPLPLANDLLVVLGEDVNKRVMSRRDGVSWNPDSAKARTLSFPVRELLLRTGRSESAESRALLLETLRSFARLRIHTRGAARRPKSRGKAGEDDGELITGLCNRLEISPTPRGDVVLLELSTDFAMMFDVREREARLLETSTYWDLGTPMARRLYRLLDWAAYARNHRGEERLQVPVHYLRDRLPIDAQKTAQIIRILDRAHEELVRVGVVRATPTYAPADADDLRRYPTYPGNRAKLKSVHYWMRLATQPAAKVLRAGVVTPPELAQRVQLLEQLSGEIHSSGLFKLIAEALDQELFDRIVSEIRTDRPQRVGAFVVSRSIELLRALGRPIPPALQRS